MKYARFTDVQIGTTPVTKVQLKENFGYQKSNYPKEKGVKFLILIVHYI